LGVLSLLGDRVPLGAKVFLTALAIVDDLGAILVLAIFYPSHDLHLNYLFYAALVVVLLFIFNRSRLRHPLYYLLPGLFLWYFVYCSGIHATIAGVILAMMIPSKTTVNEVRFNVQMRYLLQRFKDTCSGEVDVLANPEQQMLLHRIDQNVSGISPLMHRFEHALHPWVTFFIMPVFALANAGVLFNGSMLGGGNGVPALIPGIFLGLLLGKPIGIFLMSFLAVKLRLADLPAGTRWMQILGVGVIGGIGFTMSIFIDNLAFTDPAYIDLGKATILITSVVAAVCGLIFVGMTTRSEKKNN
jgi:NhaA family Na+:H+ antiporter